jgi:hypothetical protein
MAAKLPLDAYSGMPLSPSSAASSALLGAVLKEAYLVRHALRLNFSKSGSRTFLAAYLGLRQAGGRVAIIEEAVNVTFPGSSRFKDSERWTSKS